MIVEGAAKARRIYDSGRGATFFPLEERMNSISFIADLLTDVDEQTGRSECSFSLVSIKERFWPVLTFAQQLLRRVSPFGVVKESSKPSNPTVSFILKHRNPAFTWSRLSNDSGQH